MRESGQVDEGFGVGLQTLPQIMRAVGAVLGAIAILIGLVYATRVFGMVITTLHNPEAFQAYLDKWATAVGGAELDVTIDGTTFHCAREVGIMVLGGGTVILGWIAMGFMVAGAKIVSWTAGDREAVKRLLAQAFGSTGRPGQNKPGGPPAP
jgi:hypothetical protein